MKKLLATVVGIALSQSAVSHASVDSDFKEYPTERFTIETGDNNYKQAYHWAFNEEGNGPEVVIFLNHGSGGEWYRDLTEQYGPCGGDYINNATDDFTGSAYDGLCVTNGQGDLVSLADFQDHFVPVGNKNEQFMLRKIVGSTAFAAWYWQDALTALDARVHIFMVGRYNVSDSPQDFDNTLFWLQQVEEVDVEPNLLPPYNFGGDGVGAYDFDERPIHAQPELANFDNMHLYKAVLENYPELDMDNIIVEGRSDGGSSAMLVASDYHIWTDTMRSFWDRNLGTAFNPDTFEVDLNNYLGGSFYSSVAMVHSFYPGCSLGGIMELDEDLEDGEVDSDGDNNRGFGTTLKLMFAFGASDSLYGSACDERVTDGAAYAGTSNFVANNHGVDGTAAVVGEVFAPADHGFDYKHVYKNLNKYSASNQSKAAASRAAIEKAVNTALTELGLQANYQLPYNLD